jgi:hypothetical protein
VALSEFSPFVAERGEVPWEGPEADQGVGRVVGERQVGRSRGDELDVGQAELAQPALGEGAHRLPGLETEDEAGVPVEFEGRLAGAGAGVDDDLAGEVDQSVGRGHHGRSRDGEAIVDIGVLEVKAIPVVVDRLRDLGATAWCGIVTGGHGATVWRRKRGGADL